MWMMLASHHSEDVMIIGKLICIVYRVSFLPANRAGYFCPTDNGL